MHMHGALYPHCDRAHWSERLLFTNLEEFEEAFRDLREALLGVRTQDVLARRRDFERLLLGHLEFLERALRWPDAE